MADLSITASSVDDDPGARHLEGTAGEALTGGQACYVAADGLIYKASTAISSYDGICVVSASAAGQPTSLVVDGSITLNDCLTRGKLYVVSANAGGICPEADLDYGQYVNVVGYATSGTAFYARRFSTGITWGAMDYPDRVTGTANAALIAYWRLDEADPLPAGATGVADSSGKNYMPTFTGQFSSGGDGQAYDHPFGHSVLGLDGVDDFVELGLFVDVTETEPWFATGAIAGWFYFPPSDGSFDYYYYHRRGNMEVYLWRSAAGVVSLAACGENYVLGTLTGWHAIGATWDGSDVRWFLDGVKVHTGTGFTFADGGYVSHALGLAAGQFGACGVGELACWRIKMTDSNMIKLTLPA